MRMHVFPQHVLARLCLLLGMMIDISMSQVCSVTTSTRTDALGPFYIESSPQTELIGPSDQINDPTKRLEVSGRVLSIRDCNTDTYIPLSNINVEAWYAGEPDSNGNFYQTNNYRGQVVSDECGFYSFVQAFPQIYPSRPIIHTHFRLSNSSNNELLVTQLYFIGDDEGYYNQDTINNVLGQNRESQAVSVVKDPNGTRQVVFDIYIDSDGNKNCAEKSTSPMQNQAPVRAPSPELRPTTQQPVSIPTSISSGAPTPPQEACGIFGLSIFCFVGCGLIRRILGLC